MAKIITKEELKELLNKIKGTNRICVECGTLHETRKNFMENRYSCHCDRD